jgi:peptidyl-prolyl cis-trans isomerase SurA
MKCSKNPLILRPWITACFTFLAWVVGLSGYAQAGEAILIDQLMGYVNTQPILRSDIQKYLRTLGLRAQIDPLYAHSEMAKKGENISQIEVVDALINNNLIEKDIPKTDAEVEQEINTIQNAGHIDRNTLKLALQKEGYEFSDYFDLIREASSKKELIGREIQPKVSISEDDIKNYYFNHLPKNSISHRAFHLQLISVNPKNYKIASAATKTAQDALKKVRQGESFEEVAKRISDDATAPQGGDLGFIDEDQMSPVIKESTKNLQIGQVTDIFTDVNGRHLILKLVDIRSNETEQLEKMKDEIRAQLMAKEYEQQIKLWVERKRQSAVIHVEK